jgi:hypothetical protein
MGLLTLREWAVTLEAKPKYVVSSTREDFLLTTPNNSPLSRRISHSATSRKVEESSACQTARHVIQL